MASSEGTGGGSDSALFSKLGGAFFGGPNSPQKVIANVRGLLANRLTGAIPDTGNSAGIMAPGGWWDYNAARGGGRGDGVGVEWRPF